MTNIQALKKVIQAANPEILENCEGEDKAHYCPNCSNTIERNIYLADVLITIMKNSKVGQCKGESFGTEIMTFQVSHGGIGHNNKDCFHWNLKENFDNQAPEVYEFLEKIPL